MEILVMNVEENLLLTCKNFLTLQVGFISARWRC